MDKAINCIKEEFTRIRTGRASAALLDELKIQLCINPGETTKDKTFSLEAVRCLGCCGLAPVIMINDKTYGRIKVSKLKSILDKYREEE